MTRLLRPRLTAVFAVLTASTAYVYALTGGMRAPLFVSQAVVVLVSLIVLFSLPRRRLRPWNLVVWTTLSVLVATNLLLHVHAYPSRTALAHVAASILGLTSTLFVVQWLLVEVPRVRLMRAIAFAVTPLIAAAIAVALSTPTAFGRANPFGLQPNWWGELAFAYTMCLLTVRSIRYKAIGGALALILLYLVQSRSGMLGTGVSVATFTILWLRSSGWRKIHRARIGAIVAVAFVLAALAIPPITSSIWHFISNNVLLLNNPYRGLDTGFTHRLGPWEQAIQAARQHPFLGVGIGRLDKVHNGFLQMASEGGVPLLLAVVAVIVKALVDGTRERAPERIWVLLGYVAYVMFQPRMLNLNLASLVFYFAIFRSRPLHRSTPPPIGDPSHDAE